MSVKRDWPHVGEQLTYALEAFNDNVQDVTDFPESVLFRVRARRAAKALFRSYLMSKAKDSKANREQFYAWLKPKFSSVTELMRFIR